MRHIMHSYVKLHHVMRISCSVNTFAIVVSVTKNSPSVTVMNQRVQQGLVLLNLLLVVLLCFYLEIPNRLIERFTGGTAADVTDTGNENALREVPQGLLEKTEGEVEENVKRIKVELETESKLPQRVIDRVKTFVFFLGHPRSGHSIVASLMDSHPHVVISHEADVFSRISRRSLAPTKQKIFNAIWNNTRNTIVSGKRAESRDQKGYTLYVDGLYQGTYSDYIDVIGDKKAGVTTKMLLKRPDKWLDVFNTLNSLTETLKVVHVIRNPYDNIATMILYTFNTKREVGDAKQSNETYKVDSGTIVGQIKLYFSCYKAIIDARMAYNLDVIQIHGKDLISDPRGTLLKLCRDLGVTCSDSYLDICASKIFKSESRTRHKIMWTDRQLRMVQNNIEKFGSLRDYNFDSM